MPRDVRTFFKSANAAATLAIASPLILISASTGWAEETKVLGAVPSIEAPTAAGASVAATADIAKAEAAAKVPAISPAAMASHGGTTEATATAATSATPPTSTESSSPSEQKTESTAAATPPATPATEQKPEATAAATPPTTPAAEQKSEATAAATAAATPPTTPATEQKSEATVAATPPATPETPAGASSAAASTATSPVTTTGTIEPPPAASSSTTAAATPAGEAAPATPAVTAPPPPPPDPVVAAVRQKLTEQAVLGRAHKDDVAAMVAFYGERSTPLWVEKSGFTSKAKDAMEEVRKADDWGLDASAFNMPSLPSGEPSTEALADAEARLSLELLKYARYAKGGRVNPQSLSRIWDQVPPIKDPKVVLGEYAATDHPSAYMRGLHPHHEQFERLRQALLKARGGATEPEEPIDEALKVKLPAGKNLKLGMDSPDVALLRQRLKVPAEDGAKDSLFDEKLADAVKSYQAANGLSQTGALTGATRTALNKEGEPKKKDTSGVKTQRILINMERWRWMPENLGPVYVWDNVPEYYTRVIKGKELLFKEKIIVGQPSWATPVFSSDMSSIVFNPSWGVPDGIKMRELLPRLRNSGGFLFFGGGGGDVLRAYGLNAYYNGRPVDPDSVNWSSADIRQYSFVQPPGGKNPLGIVKFRFPNKHDVYMHDTVERPLFAQSNRALSHGCMRVQNPTKFAQVLLAEANGWDDAKVQSAIRGGGEITLQKPIPVHVTYFTAMVEDDGSITTFGDIYGHDSRLSAALGGKAIPYEAPTSLETASADDDDDDYGDGPAPSPAASYKKSKKKSYSGPATLSEAISGLLTN